MVNLPIHRCQLVDLILDSGVLVCHTIDAHWWSTYGGLRLWRMFLYIVGCKSDLLESVQRNTDKDFPIPWIDGLDAGLGVEGYPSAADTAGMRVLCLAGGSRSFEVSTGIATKGVLGHVNH